MDIEATWGGVTLASYAALHRVNDFLIDGVAAAQSLAGARRVAAGVQNRQNVAHTITFTNMRPAFGSPLLASQFIVDHAIALQAVTTNADLSFTMGSKVYVMREAVVVRRVPSIHRGATVEHAYTIVGGKIEDITPP